MATFGQSLFGQSGTPGFGSAATTPAPFGAATGTSLFGSTTPAPFGATQGFGATAATPPAFGQAPATPSLFGQPAAQQQSTAPFSFSSATPLFGSTPPQQQQQQQQQGTPSLFGTFGAVNTPSPFGQTTPGMFGAAASTPATSSSPFGGLFGGTQPATAAAGSMPSLFGSAFAPQPAASTFGLGGASATAASVFGTAPTQPGQQQVMPAGIGSTAAPDTAVKEIIEIRNAYVPGSPSFKFHHLFLNVVDDPRQRVKPPQVDEMRWRQALAQAGGAENPDRLWPVLATGFRDLRLRAQAQQQAIQENVTQLQRMSDQAHQLSRRHTLDLRLRSAAVQRRHGELAHRLLRCCRYVDALEARLAANSGYGGDLSRAKEQEISRSLAAVEVALGPGGVNLQQRVHAVGAAARLRLGGPPDSNGGQVKLDEDSAQRLFSVLKEHAAAAKQLQAVLRRDQLDVQIMSQGRLDTALAV